MTGNWTMSSGRSWRPSWSGTTLMEAKDDAEQQEVVLDGTAGD